MSHAVSSRVAEQMRPDTGALPGVQEMNEDTRLFLLWRHVKFVRSHGKKIPLKPRRCLSERETQELRRNLERLAHHARYALAYLAKEK